MDITLGTLSQTVPLITSPEPGGKASDFATYFNQSLETMKQAMTQAEPREESTVPQVDLDLQGVKLLTHEIDPAVQRTAQFRHQALDAYRDSLGFSY